MLTHLVTNIVIMKISDISGSNYESVVEVFESNPVAKWVLLNQKLKNIFSFVILPSFLGGLYWVMRKRTHPVSLQFFSVFIFLVALFNVNNDIGVLLGLLI